MAVNENNGDQSDRIPLLDSVSFILIKPDGLDNPLLLEELELQIKDAELEAIRKFDVKFTRGDLDMLWPNYANYPITMQLLHKYLAEKLLTMRILIGADAIQKTKKIKDIIRKKFSLGAFANCIHTPADLEELKFQLTFIAQKPNVSLELASDILIFDPPKQEILPGLWGRMTKLGESEFERVVLSVWKTISTKRWAEIAVPSNGEFNVMLVDDDCNGIDYVTSCLCEVFPELPPEKAIVTVLEVDRTGGVTVYSGNKEDADFIAGKLKDHKLETKIRRNVKGSFRSDVLNI